jgi:hypothetical protein
VVAVLLGPGAIVTAAARDQFVALLSGGATPGAFSAQRTASVDDLCLEVRGMGQVLLPVPDSQAKQLCQLGRPARFGRGEQTLLDPKVRDTWEIPKSRVKIDKRRWDKTLVPVLDRLRGDLDLPSGCELKAEFHSMLVYARGQFFLPHQDSEKADAMVGSLIVTLPSLFTGGALVVEHGGETSTHRSSKKSLSFVAFYADCRHQVRPVRSGHRIVLTYNLVLQGETATSAMAEAAPELIDELARCVNDHFVTPPPPPRASGPVATDPPKRLVYLLDHEYTPTGLSWSRLKGSDAKRAALLRAAATSADCDIVVALADVHETWSCFEPQREAPWYSRARHNRWDDVDDDAWTGEMDDTDTDGYQLEELVDWSITVDCCADPSGTPAEPVAAAVDATEVCSTTPSVDLRPYASEYEGYMGNYGNTMDRWYRRGALVLWPRKRAFAVHAEASPEWALGALSTRLRAGDLVGAQEMAATLAPFWNSVARGDQPRSVFTQALRVAHALDQEALAAMLLGPFRVELLAKSHAKSMVALVKRYGQAWASDLLAVWSNGRRQWEPSPSQDRLAWAAKLGVLCDALQASGDAGEATARLLVQGSWRWLSEAIDQRLRLPAPSYREEALSELGPPIAAILEGAAVISAADLRDEAVGFLCHGNDDLLACLMPVLRAAAPLPPDRWRDSGFDVVAQHCATRLTARLARPRRTDDDWSVDVPTGCNCNLCDILGGFLSDPVRRSFEWPLAKEGRRHVHGRLDGAEMPVRHQTRRTGRPYTLMLTKTEAIFQREREARSRDEADLAWLDGEWGAITRRDHRRRSPPANQDARQLL